MADAVVGVIDELEESLPDFGRVALAMACAEVADGDLPNSGVLIGQLEQFRRPRRLGGAARAADHTAISVGLGPLLGQAVPGSRWRLF